MTTHKLGNVHRTLSIGIYIPIVTQGIPWNSSPWWDDHNPAHTRFDHCTCLHSSGNLLLGILNFSISPNNRTNSERLN
jgi:hypothetical protein